MELFILRYHKTVKMKARQHFINEPYSELIKARIRKIFLTRVEMLTTVEGRNHFLEDLDINASRW